MKKILIVNWHGLGDSVMLTPALRKFKELNPDSFITLGCQKRFGNTIKELLSDLPFIDEILPIFSDLWSYYPDIEVGCRVLDNEIIEIADNYDEIITLDCERQKGFLNNKIFRFATDLGVTFSSIEELQSKLHVNNDARKRVSEFFELHNLIEEKTFAVHFKSGLKEKDLPEKDRYFLIDNLIKDGFKVIEIGTSSHPESIYIPEDNMEFTKALVEAVNGVLAIDSVVMHIAGALKKYLMPIFTVTDIIQAIPLAIMTRIIKLGDIDLGENNLSEYYKNLKLHFSVSPNENYLPTDSSFCIRGSGVYERWEAIKRETLKNPPKRILDIGCNTGFFSRELAKMFPKCKVVGVDTDPKVIAKAKELSKGLSNVYFDLVKGDLLDFLFPFNDNSIDYILYMSVHHHVCKDSPDKEKYILSEISRIGNNMFFDMGQCDEIDNGWLDWKDNVPKFNKVKNELSQYLVNNTEFTNCKALSSTFIHGTKRWFYLLNKKIDAPKTLIFNNEEYEVKRYLWKEYGYGADLKISDKGFLFDSNVSERTRFYIVEKGNALFWVKEFCSIPEDPSNSPEKMAKIEWDRRKKAEKLLGDDKYLVKTIALENNKILMELLDRENWVRSDTKGFNYISEKLLKELEEVAYQLYEGLSGFDFNLNNIFISKDLTSFKLIDFAEGSCSLLERLNFIKDYFRSSKME